MSWMDDDVSTDEVNPDQLDRGTVSKPGRYHAELVGITTVENKKNGGEEIRFDFQILAGDVKSEVGNLFYHRERDPNGDQTRIFFMTKLAVQLGVVAKDEVGEGKPPFKPRRFWNAQGRQYVIEVVATPGKKREDGTIPTYLNLGRVWHPNDDAVADVPKDLDALEAAGAKPAKAAAPTKPAANVDDL